MNNETQKVDVLLAFDNAATHFHRQRMPSSSEEMRLARDAVAELIEAVNLGGDMPKKDGAEHAGMFFTATNAARLRAALARIGGVE